MSEGHLGDRLVAVFDRVFRTTEDTVLRGGAAEPYYEPGSPSVIHFRETLTEVLYTKLLTGVSQGRRAGTFPTTDTGTRPMAEILTSRARFTVLR